MVVADSEELGLQLATERFRFMQDLIDIRRAAEPFSSLPARERVIAHVLHEAIGAGQKDAALSRLQELGSALGARLNEANRRATRNLVLSAGGLLVALTAIPLAIIF